MTRHILAETQVAGFGLANGNVVDRLALTVDERHDAPAMLVTHTRIDHPDPLDEQDKRAVTVAQSRVTPTACDGPDKIEPGMGPFRDRVVIEHHDHAPRAYVRHESREGGAWHRRNEWELHPAEGVVQTVEGEVIP